MTPGSIWPGRHRQQAQASLHSLARDFLRCGALELSFGNILHIKALCSWATVPLHRGAIGEVLRSLQPQGDLSLDAFEAEHAHLRRSRQPKEHAWRFLLPLPLELADGIRRPARLRVLGRDFLFTTWSSSRRWVTTARLEARLKRLLPYKRKRMQALSSYTCLSATASGPSWRDAWHRQLQTPFETLRGLLEISFGFGTTEYGVSSNPRSRSWCQHPQWLIAIRGDGRLDGAEFVIEAERAKLAGCSAGTWSVIKSNGASLRREAEEQSVRSVMAAALRLYGRALDAQFDDEAVIALWQMAEALTLSDAVGGDTKQVASRLTWLCHEWCVHYSVPGLSDVLGATGRLRNRYVHSGVRGELDDEDFVVLKIASEQAFRWLLIHQRDLTSRPALEAFLRFYARPDTDVRATLEAVGFIKKARGK